jgi:thiamine kinase-like enzyme
MQTSPLQSLIQPTKLPAVEKALAQTFKTATLSDIKPLAGGLSTSAVYKIIVDEQSYVLKVDNTGGPVNNSCMEIAAKAGIAPALYYLDAQEGVSITRFIDNKPLRVTFSSPETLTKELADTIRSIHGMPPFAKEGSLLDTLQSLIGQLKGSPLFPKDFFEYFDIILQHYPWQDTDKVSSHNDLNPNNMVCDGQRIWVVDWDAAFLNDRYVDLAIAANFFVHNEAQEALFLEAYFGDKLNNQIRARFFIMRQICYLIYAILMFNLAQGSGISINADDPELQAATLREIGAQLGAGTLSLATGKGQLLYGKAMLNEALKNMQSPRFEPSIKLLI